MVCGWRLGWPPSSFGWRKEPSTAHRDVGRTASEDARRRRDARIRTHRARVRRRSHSRSPRALAWSPAAHPPASRGFAVKTLMTLRGRSCRTSARGPIPSQRHATRRESRAGEMITHHLDRFCERTGNFLGRCAAIRGRRRRRWPGLCTCSRRGARFRRSRWRKNRLQGMGPKF